MASNRTTLVGLAALVSVITSLTTVMLWGSLSGGAKDAKPAKPAAPMVEAMATEVARLRAEVAELKAAGSTASQVGVAGVEGLRQAVAAQAARLEELEAGAGQSAIAARVAEAEGAARSEADRIEAVRVAEEAAEPPTREQLQETLAKFKALGFGAYGAPGFQAFAAKIKELGPEGIAFVAEEMHADDPMQRFLAAGLAEKLQAPELIPDLEEAALADDNFIVRRMSSHALAFMGNDATADSLVKIVRQETRDMGVSLNAWYGLADQGHPEAAASFPSLLDRAGGEVSPDMVVDTAIKLANKPGMLSMLRDAYSRETVSVAIRARILATLGAADDHRFDPFLQSVASDANAAQPLRAAAQRALDAR